MFPKIEFTPAIQERISGMHLAMLLVRPFKITKNSAVADNAFEENNALISEKFLTDRPAQNEVVSAVRRMYRRVGWEPTRYRPSSEAMIRRILKKSGLYRINNAVDIGNAVSVRYHLPMGLYDVLKINGTVQVDIGSDTESYVGISKAEIHAGGKLILRDRTGIFGNPTADSKRTSITTNTEAILAVFFVPPEVDRVWTQATLDWMSELLREEQTEAKCSQKIVTC